MAYRILLLAFLASTLAKPLQEQVTKNIDHEDEYYHDPEAINDSEEIQESEDTTSVPTKTLKAVKAENVNGLNIVELKGDREELTTQKPVAKYEVTELVIDVPDDSTRRVPILTNFTLTRPLNFAGVPINKTNNIDVNIKDDGDEIINSFLIPDEPKDTKNDQGQNVKGNNNKFNGNKDENDYFNHFDTNDSFEEEFDKEFGSDEDYLDNFESKEEPEPTKGFKNHFHNFGKNIVNKFKSVVHKHKDDIHDSLRKIVNGPVSFFNKLHRKSSDLAKKLHNAVSRHKYHDEEDDIGYHNVDHDHGDDC